MIRLLIILGLCIISVGCTTAPASQDAAALMRERPDLFVVVTMRNDGAPIDTRAGSTARGYSASRYSVSSGARFTARALASAHQLKEVSSWPIAALGVHCVVFELPRDTTVGPMLERLRRDSRIESAQPLHAFATQTTSYNDPYEDLQRSLVTMDVIPAHNWSRGAGIRVAVIDTGIDATHPDLTGRIAEQKNFVDDDADTFKTDKHGTAVAGVIAASANNEIGIVGVAPEARVHAFKACWQQQAPGTGAVCNTFTLAKALAAALDARVQIVNLSLGGPDDALLTRLIARGQEQGIVFVGASPLDRSMGFPTGVDGVIEVAGFEQASATGSPLLAPGAEILTLVPQGHYDFASGSSVATANVSGTIALLLARDRKVTAAALKDLLATTAKPIAADTNIRSVNACAALSALLNERACPGSDTVAAAERHGHN